MTLTTPIRATLRRTLCTLLLGAAASLTPAAHANEVFATPEAVIPDDPGDVILRG